MEKIQLRRLQATDGENVYRMLQQIGANENDFTNSMYGKPKEEFAAWLQRGDGFYYGRGLLPGMVRNGTYWLFADETPVGYGKLRFAGLEAPAVAQYGHIGYAVAKPYRGKGYGVKLLAGLLAEAEKEGLKEVMLHVNRANNASYKTAARCGGVIREDKYPGMWEFWFSLV
ncbi:MAG: GNAT family N-acetyltransferase [Oscillospiraceae bacterium]|nr:GNAT family N-acetyltransferase [Oscillospiraceae bacterium]